MKFSLFLAFILFSSATIAQPIISHETHDRSIIFTIHRAGANIQGAVHRIRVTPYGDHILRIQSLREDEIFFADDRYEMVEKHNWPGKLNVSEQPTYFSISTGSSVARLDKGSLAFSFYMKQNKEPFLAETQPTSWEADTIRTSFVYDPREHFTGLGHGYFGRAESIDLKGNIIERNYGTEHHQQAPLIVPYYISSKGYGVFLNSTFPNQFNFGKNEQYQFSISGPGRMDYFVIAGPKFSDILDRYTMLTGRPRLPPKAFFGLALSDKGNDHLSTDSSDEQWWRKKITAHRNAGFPLDHIVNDNRWRAGGGQRCLSRFEWDPARYPKPAAYAQWVKNNGLISTLDLNRCIAVQSEGWKPSFNLPESKGIAFNTSAPDLTKKEVRDWFWKLFWTKSLNPALKFPGDALWIDEFDEMGKTPLDMKFENGTNWQEMRNYWFFLVAKSLVQQGWDTHFKGSKRPFVWVRGMTAGAQRYATLWSGDIRCTYADMKTQVRGMQLAGLSGFPFWGHDAGGFFLDNNKDEPNDTLYRQWSMAFGSFTPFWKPHGMGKSRWPLDRPKEVQKDAHTYSELRYRLMPYLYSYAHLASTTGLPIARSMVLDHQDDPRAWTHDLQYMWGNEILAAPVCSNGGEVTVWFPKGQWYDFWNSQLIHGNKVIQYDATLGKLPLFIKAGAIIPMANFALSTAFIRADTLNIHVYTGEDGHFTLYEDDGVTENYVHKKEKRTTSINFNQSAFTLKISPAVGSYQGALRQRAYRVVFHGLKKPVQLSLDGKRINGVWNAKQGILEIKVTKRDVTKIVLIM